VNRLTLPDYKTMRELRHWVKDGLLMAIEAKMLLAPQVFVSAPDDDDEDKKEGSTKEPAIGFKIEKCDDD